MGKKIEQVLSTDQFLCLHKLLPTIHNLKVRNLMAPFPRPQKMMVRSLGKENWECNLSTRISQGHLYQSTKTDVLCHLINFKEVFIFCILIILISFIYQSSGPVHSLPLIHGKAGVSHLCLHNNTMYSAGRDGVYRQLRIHNNTLEVIDTKKVLIIAA